jgi:predicted hydrolase (HD superfamily)
MKGKKVQTGEKDTLAKTPEINPVQKTETPKQSPSVNTANLKLPTRNEAIELIQKYSTGTWQHLFQVGAIMEYFAKKLGEDAHYWWLVGALHDIDWDFVGKDGSKHLKDEFNTITDEIHLPEELKADIRSHGYFLE